MAPGLFTARLCRVRNKSSFAVSIFRGLVPINSGLRAGSKSRAVFWSSSSFSWDSKTIWESLQSLDIPRFRLLMSVTTQSWCWPALHSQTPLLHAPLATKKFLHTLKQSRADLFSAPAWDLREHAAPPSASQACAFPLRLLGHDPDPPLSALHCISEMLLRETCPKGAGWAVGDGGRTPVLGLVTSAAVCIAWPLGVLSWPQELPHGFHSTSEDGNCHAYSGRRHETGSFGEKQEYGRHYCFLKWKLVFPWCLQKSRSALEILQLQHLDLPFLH